MLRINPAVNMPRPVVPESGRRKSGMKPRTAEIFGSTVSRSHGAMTKMPHSP